VKGGVGEEVKTLTSSGDVNGRESDSQLKTFVQWRIVKLENIKCAPTGDKIVTLFFYQIILFVALNAVVL
jgi:hypothetical protein